MSLADGQPKSAFWHALTSKLTHGALATELENAEQRGRGSWWGGWGA